MTTRRRASATRSAAGPAELDIETASADAVDRATRLLGAKKAAQREADRRLGPPGDSDAARDPRGHALRRGGGQGPLPLRGPRRARRSAADELTLVDDPTNPLAYGASEHDAEGLACRCNSLISAGELKGFLYDTYAARLAGTCSTGSAVRGGFRTTPGVGAQALALEPGSRDQAEIIAQVGEGFLVQSITGVHSGVNRVSGDFSVGAEGLMIRGGELAEPVREVTIASTIQRMLQHVVAIGSDVEWLPGAAAGVTLAIDDLALSGS